MPGAPAMRWYACGPTVYDRAHLGHARTYVCFDVLRRVAEERFGRRVFMAVGVTDVDDKILARAAERGEDPLELARHHEDGFFEDMARLNVRPPSTVLRVSDHVDDIVAFVAALERDGFAYRAPGGVLFDVAAFEAAGHRYGALRPAAFEARDGDEAGKRNPQDFALWKEAKPGEGLSWPSPWGEGRPGWHIECSAMTAAAFGETFDLHTGGVDLCFPHHTNEIAQSCARFGRSAWVPHWAHTGHLHIAGRKMSKSLKNFVTVDEFLGRHSAAELRAFCLLHRYRAAVDWSEERMAEAREALRRFEEFERAAQTAPASSGRWGGAETALAARAEEGELAVDRALADDLDTPAAMAALAETVRHGRAYLGDRGGRAANGPLVRHVAAAVSRTLGQFGVSVGGGGKDGAARADAVAEQLAALRHEVREAALTADGAASPLRGQVLALCDTYREEKLPAAGVLVRDGGATPQYRLLSETETAQARRHGGGSASPNTVPASARAAPADPDTLFRGCGDYGAFDADGVPTRDAAGQELSKSARKKLRKKMDKARRVWERFGGGQS